MEYVEVARAQSGRGELVLRERRDPDDPDGTRVLELRVNGVFVMDTLETSTERELASASLRQVENPHQVVIAGLGLGFTLHEVLADPRVEHVAVVEIEDTLVQWMRDGTVPHGPTFLADERVQVVTADVRMAMAEATPQRWDMILLDVDNGPDNLVYEDNAAVYEREFLGQVAEALAPGGAVVVWSASQAPQLAAAMEDVFGNAAQVPHEVDLQGRAEQYWLYLSRRR
jgi:spermidine synthase